MRANAQQFNYNGDDFIKFILFTLDGYIKKITDSEQQKYLVQNTIDLFTAVIPCVWNGTFLRSRSPRK